MAAPRSVLLSTACISVHAIVVNVSNPEVGKRRATTPR